MRNENQCDMRVSIEFEEQLADARPGCGIKVSRGLIREQHRGPRDERSRKRDALLLTPRQLAWIVAGTTLEANALERLQSGAASIGSARELQREHDILQRSQRRDEMERLKDESDALRPQTRPPVLIEPRKIRAFEQHPTGRR